MGVFTRSIRHNIFTTIKFYYFCHDIVPNASILIPVGNSSAFITALPKPVHRFVIISIRQSVIYYAVNFYGASLSPILRLVLLHLSHCTVTFLRDRNVSIWDLASVMRATSDSSPVSPLPDTILQTTIYI